MEISKAAVGFLVGACVAAGAGGAYVVTRDSAPVALASEGSELTELAPPVSAVEHSEGVLTDARPPVAPAPAAAPIDPAPRSRAARPTPTPSRGETSERPRRTAVPPAPPASAPASEVAAPLPIEPPTIADNQPSRIVEPAGPVFDELVVAAESVIGLEIETAVTSERARVEDAVTARVTRDVRVGDRVAIPAGSRVQGEVTMVERGGRLRERARLGVRFTSIVLADGTRLPIDTETIFREGDPPTGESAAKIGGGAIGGAVGAGGGTAAVLAGGRNAATLPAGTPVTVRVEDPVTVTVER